MLPPPSLPGGGHSALSLLSCFVTSGLWEGGAGRAGWWEETGQLGSSINPAHLWPGAPNCLGLGAEVKKRSWGTNHPLVATTERGVQQGRTMGPLERWAKADQRPQSLGPQCREMGRPKLATVPLGPVTSSLKSVRHWVENGSENSVCSWARRQS